jgi:hypothetical protein
MEVQFVRERTDVICTYVREAILVLGRGIEPCYTHVRINGRVPRGELSFTRPTLTKTMSSGPTIPNLAGGAPIRHYDLAPSVLFIALYTPFLLALPFRLLQSITRRRQASKFVGQHGPNPIGRAPNLIFLYFRIMLFVPIRIVALIIRAIQAADSYPPNPFTSSAAKSLDLIITEQVLISIGFFFLLNAVQTLIVSHISYLPPDDTIANRMRRFTRLSELFILAAVALSILAATGYSAAASDPSKANQVKTYR